MNISKNHILMLAIVSIFTGMIAPSIENGTLAYPYALTNMQYIAYGILFGLTILFVTSSFHFRKITIFLTSIMILLILSLAIMSITGLVQSFSGAVLQNFSWGWIFLSVWLMLLGLSLTRNYNDTNNIYDNMFEKIIGICGFIVLIILTTFIIFVAEHSSKKVTITSEIGKIFPQNDLQNSKKITISPAFENISHFQFDRKNDILSFIWQKNNTFTLFGENKKLDNFEEIETIKHIAGRTFFVLKNGVVMEKDEILGITPMTDFSENFLLYKKSDNSITVISDAWENNFANESGEIEKIYFQESTGDVFWKSQTENGEKLYKNGVAISDEYRAILRFAIARDGTTTLIIEGENGEKMVVRNATIIHTMFQNYVPGTLQMNGSNTIYVIQNDDKSFSIVANGTVMDKRLDEIRDIFLEKNSNGYSYFGRPQGENQYCLFTRYRGNLCGLSGYMNPQFEADGVGIIFAGLKDGKWAIYRNTTEFIKNFNYQKTSNFSDDYFFFDTTNPRYFLIVEKNGDKYVFNKMWEILDERWNDFDIHSVNWNYDSKVLLKAQDDAGWHIVEL